jgi:hypothetical protein
MPAFAGSSLIWRAGGRHKFIGLGAWGKGLRSGSYGAGSGLSADFSIANYRPPGPVAEAFIRAPERVPFIMGPVGSGKTTAALFRCLRYSASIPRCKDGVIRAKGAIVRSDYRTLYGTTLPSWHSWFPPTYPGSKFIGGADRPATHEIAFTTPRGQRMEIIIEFKALGDKRIEDIMRGWEGTWALMEEADLMSEDALDFLFQRSNRYPRRELLEGEASLKRCVMGSLNPPGSPDHWIVRRFIQRKKADGSDNTGDEKLYVQPSGLSPQAENIPNLADGFYEELAANSPDYHVQRFVHGKVGWDRSGMPVYPEFDPRQHVAPVKLKPTPGVPIFLGLDCSGLHPAAVIVQRGASLQIRVLEEFYFDRMGPTRFTEMLVAGLQERYRDCPLERGFYDPSNDYGADKEGGEQSWIDILMRALGRPLNPAPTNEVPLRVECVRNLLMQPIGEARGLLVSPGCTMLIDGFMARYRYKLNPDGTIQNRANPRPEKNAWANPQDALQYVCLGLIGRAGSIASAAAGIRPGAGQTGSGNGVMKADFQL